MNRRDFFKSAGILLAAPAIVRAESIMPVRSMPISCGQTGIFRVNPALLPTGVYTAAELFSFARGGHDWPHWEPMEFEIPSEWSRNRPLFANS